MSIADSFYTRIKAGISPQSTSLVDYIQNKTYLNMKPFSFKGHEYQQYITELVQKDPNIDLSAEKPSQTGVSELCFRIALSEMALLPGYSIGYGMPSKAFSQEVLKTRMSPIIDQSPELKGLISKDVDSASVKQFTNGSTLYALGLSANSQSSLVNRPITLVIIDEVDRCDMKIATGLRSRQTHSKYKPWIYISTPTAPGIGINALSDNRQVHTQLVICHSCGKEYKPDFFEQVKLPGFDEPIEILTKDKLNRLGLDPDTAYHHCPYCHTHSILTPENRQWVVEDAHLPKIHVVLTPFDAPEFITPGDLVTSMLTYTNPAEFRNQALGLTSKLSDSAMDPTAVEFTKEEAPSGINIGGLDLGKTSYFMKGVLSGERLFVDLIETVPLAELQDRISSNIATHKLTALVSDSLPYQDTVLRATNQHAQFWGAVYTTPNMPQPELYKLKMSEETNTRQVNIQKNLMMDHVVGMIMSGQIVFKSGPFDEVLVKHLTDMRRVRDYRFQEMRYKWVKSDKSEDHLFHTLIYLVTASKLFENVRFNTGFGVGLPLVSSFKSKKDL